LEVLKVFNDLLEHENMQVRTFVNGTLYSLLSRPVFKEQAKAMGMDEILSYLMENSDERYRKQIQYIFEQLNSDKVEDDAQSDGNDEDNDYDDMEDDDEIGEVA
jgi:LisH domain-containing protein ARMC9